MFIYCDHKCWTAVRYGKTYCKCWFRFCLNCSTTFKTSGTVDIFPNNFCYYWFWKSNRGIKKITCMYSLKSSRCYYNDNQAVAWHLPPPTRPSKELRRGQGWEKAPLCNVSIRSRSWQLGPVLTWWQVRGWATDCYHWLWFHTHSLSTALFVFLLCACVFKRGDWHWSWRCHWGAKGVNQSLVTPLKTLQGLETQLQTPKWGACKVAVTVQEKWEAKRSN